MVLLTVMFTQVGLNLLHTHQGQPQEISAAFHDAQESGNTPCPVCAMDGVQPLSIEAQFVAVPLFFTATFKAVSASSIILPVTGFSAGRAPPVC